MRSISSAGIIIGVISVLLSVWRGCIVKYKRKSQSEPYKWNWQFYRFFRPFKSVHYDAINQYSSVEKDLLSVKNRKWKNDPLSLECAMGAGVARDRGESNQIMSVLCNVKHARKHVKTMGWIGLHFHLFDERKMNAPHYRLILSIFQPSWYYYGGTMREWGELTY